MSEVDKDWGKLKQEAPGGRESNPKWGRQEGLMEEATFEQRIEDGEGVN